MLPLSSELDTRCRKNCSQLLELQGYYVIQSDLEMPSDETVKRWYSEALASRNLKWVFNRATIQNNGDSPRHLHKLENPLNERFQICVSTKQEWVRLVYQLAEVVDQSLPSLHYEFKNPVLLGSTEQCKSQPANCDWSWKDDCNYLELANRNMNNPSRLPMSAILILQDNTTIRIWPASHKIIEKRLGKFKASMNN